MKKLLFLICIGLITLSCNDNQTTEPTVVKDSSVNVEPTVDTTTTTVVKPDTIPTN